VRCRYTLALLAAAACQRADDHRDEPRDPSGPLRLVVNGHGVAARSVLAAKRGGETVYLILSSAADRSCDQLFDDRGVALAPDEVLVSLDVAQPAFERDHPRWQIARASWPGGVSGAVDAHGESLDSTVRIPDDIATRGGKLAVRYTGSFSVGAASPNASIAIDGTTDVKPCGDRRPASTPPQLVSTIGARRFPLRGAVVTSDDSGWRLTLASLPLACPNHDVWDGPGDLGIDITTRGSDRSVHIFGDAVPVQQQISRDGISIQPDAAIDGDGPLGIAIDVGLPEIAIRGRVTAKRCPK
jgi:hypothetical protein